MAGTQTTQSSSVSGQPASSALALLLMQGGGGGGGGGVHTEVKVGNTPHDTPSYEQYRQLVCFDLMHGSIE